MAAATAQSPLRSPNLLRNTTFKQCTVGNFPDYWGPHHVNLSRGWQNSFIQVEEKEKSPVPGTECLRLWRSEDGKQGAHHVEPTWHTLQSFRTYTFSCYLKAAIDGHPVRFEMGQYHRENPKKTVTVGTEWERHFLTGAPVKGCWFGRHWDVLVVSLNPRGKGPLWMAAPQLESGDEMTPYQPADADVFVPEEIEKQLEFPTIPSTSAKTPPSLEGSVGDLTAGAGPIGALVDAADGLPTPKQYRTSFRVFHDDHRVHVLVRCNDPKITGPDWRGDAKPDEAEWRILYRDSVWLYLKSDFGDQDYFAFGCDTEGNRCDVAWYWFGWNRPVWSVETRKGKGYWAAAFTIPFHLFLQVTGGRAIGESIGINVRRIRKTEDGSDGGLAKQKWFWSPDRATRLPCGFGKLAGIDTKRVRACRVMDGRLAFAGVDGIDAILELDYVPDLQEQASLEAELTAPDGKVSTKTATVPLNGEARVLRIEGVGSGPKVGTYRLVARITDKAGKPIGKYTQRVHAPETLRLPDNDLIATVERSYYTNEKLARVMLRSNLDVPLACTVTLTGRIRSTFPSRVLTDKPVTVPTRGRAIVAFDISALPELTYTLCVEASGAGGEETAARAFEIFRKLPPAPEGRPEVKIDRFRHMIRLDDRPVIMWSGKGEHFSEAAQFVWGGGWGGTKDITKAIERAGVNSIGYMFRDEPGPGALEAVAKEYRRFKEADPYRLACFLAGAWPLDARRVGMSAMPGVTDLAAASFYPWGCANVSVYTLGQKRFHNLRVTAHDVSYMGDIVRKFGIAGWMNLPTYSAGESVFIGTLRHHRCMVYLGLAHGVRAFSEWGGHPVADELWHGFKVIKEQLEVLTPILGDTTAFEEDRVHAGKIHYALWSSKGRYYLIACNPWPEPNAFRYDLTTAMGAPLGSLRAMFDEGRKPEVEDGQLKARFGPYESAIYECSTRAPD